MAERLQGGGIMRDAVTALTLGRPESEENPYNMAVYLHELIQLAASVAPEGLPGFSALMTVIEERANILGQVLDAPAFSTHWFNVDAWLVHDPFLGFKDTLTYTVPGAD